MMKQDKSEEEVLYSKTLWSDEMYINLTLLHVLLSVLLTVNPPPPGWATKIKLTAARMNRLLLG